MLKTHGCPVLYGRSNRGVYPARLYEQITTARDGITELTDGRRREIYSFISSLVSFTKKQAYYQHKSIWYRKENCVSTKERTVELYKGNVFAFEVIMKQGLSVEMVC